MSDSNIGLQAPVATHCVGTSTSGTQGLQAVSVASYCRGTRDGGVAISAGVAVACTVSGTGTISATSKFLGTP